ncbi:MAG TPA: thioesterase family protein [Candidatus Elarobacter sp.]|nr:thioesterase family protein [Dongiaceae bacterium]HZW52797.1 thioesterase family protein [Candidatus Elarobacter sp.]
MRGRTHVTRTRVRFGETDAAGIVFYPAFFAWFDVGTTGLFRAAGGTMLGPDNRPRWPIPIVESGARFLAPLAFDDPVEIRSTVAELGTSSLRVEHEVVRDGVVVATGFEVRVLIGYDGGRIGKVAIPDGLRRALAEETSTADEVA